MYNTKYFKTRTKGFSVDAPTNVCSVYIMVLSISTDVIKQPYNLRGKVLFGLIIFLNNL